METTSFLSLSAREQRIVAMALFWPRAMDADVLRPLLADSDGSLPSPSAIGASLGNLKKAGWFAKIGSSSHMALAAPVSRAVVDAVRTKADAEGWWPTAERAGDSNARDLFPELHRHSASGARKSPSFDMLISELVRLFSVGCGEGASEELVKALDGNRGLELTQAAAHLAAKRFAETPDLSLRDGDVLVKLLRPWCNAAFLAGRDVRPALKAVNRLLMDGATVEFSLLRTFTALCAWTASRDLFAIPSRLSDDPFFLGCDSVLCNDIARAEKFFKGEGFLHDDSDEKTDYDNVPERFLTGLASAAEKPDKVAKQRPARQFQGRLGSLRIGYNLHPLAQAYRKEVDECSLWASAHWKMIADGKPEILDAYRKLSGFGMIDGLFLAWNYHSVKVNRKPYAALGAHLWETAHRLDANGWAGVASLFASLLSGAYDAAAEAEFLCGLDKRGVAFLPRVEPEPVWKSALFALEKAIPRSSKKSDAGSADDEAKERLVWCLALENGESRDLLDIVSFYGAIRPAYGAEDGSDDEVLERYDFEKNRVRKLMSDRDRLIEAARYQSSYYGSSVRWTELLPRLCGATNLWRRDIFERNWRREYGHAHRIVLEQRPCELTATAGEDGGLVLSVPPWVIELADDWFLRKIDADRYAYVEIPKETRKLVSVFREFGEKGRLAIPREGMTRIEPLMEKITQTMPLAEPPAENAKRLRHVKAGCDLHVRLDYADGVLIARAVILPLADNPNLTLDPGSGPTEKMVVGAVANFVLVRDLEAEKAAFEPIRQALRDDEGAFDGRSAWRFDDLAEAIGALAKLKALEPSVPLDWMHEHRLCVVNAPKSGVRLSSQRTADDWFRVEGEFKLDDGRVCSIVQMLEAARGRVGSYVKLSEGDYVALTKSMVRELDALNAAGRRKGDGLEIVKAAIPMLDGAFGGDDDALELPDAMAVTAREIRSAFAKKPSVPRTLNAELRPYQEDGYRWLSRLAACGFGSCLADDMGLGKTIQVISLLLERAKNGTSLVVAPSSVCGNWRRELQRFAPSLRPVMAMEESTELGKTGPFDVVITSYGYLLFHEEAFAAVTWNGLVLDEAQAIKNDASKRAKAVKRFHVKFRVAATGTPVENRLGELWSLFDFLNPGLLGPAASFAQRLTDDGKASPELKRLVKPLILRRLKGDVLDDLPEKTEVTIPVELGSAERTAYEGCRQHALAQLRSQAESDGGEANRMSILAELTRLRRFCCHPSLVLPGQGVPSAKMEALVELLDGLHEGHNRALVFSQFTDYLALVRKMIDAHGWSHLYLDGATPTLEREKLVNAFQSGEGDFFLISLKAGGTGLNLTAANYVILLDPWWNPAVENQAADRAHRIGQKNPVTVYRLIASDTVEARVIELHREKKAIAEDVLEGTSSTALSPAQLMRLFA